jgi:4'-phosphopantetheinyl transferase EntD
MSPPVGIAFGIAAIAPTDFALLTTVERASLGHLPAKRIAASGRARQLARALAGLAIPPGWNIVKDVQGVPQWPDGVLGSLAHTNTFAAACTATRGELSGLGIDVEGRQPLDESTASLVASPRERARFPSSEGALQIFAIKEATFKACFPNDRRFLEFDQIEVHADHAVTSYGRVVRHTLLDGPALLALAWL